MKGKMKFAVVALLLAVFVAAFAEEAFAAKNPNWVGRKITWSIERNTDQQNAGAPDYWRVRIRVNHTNNSSDRDITAFYDKQVRFRAVLNRDFYYARQIPGANVSHTINSSRVNNVTVWPGRSSPLNYYIPLGNLLIAYNREWGQLNREISALSNQNSIFKDVGIGYDFHIRSKRSN
jgi:hypothetical protein